MSKKSFISNNMRRFLTQQLLDCWACQITEQQPPPGAWNGSSFLSTGPHTDGKRGSLVDFTYARRLREKLVCISQPKTTESYVALASDTLILGKSSCSRSLWVCSINLRSFNSDILLEGVFFLDKQCKMMMMQNNGYFLSLLNKVEPKSATTR